MLATYTTKPFTDRTWANYEQGKRPIPDREFVLMGLVVGATPEDAEAVGRAEAGKLLRQEIERRRAPIVSGVPKETIERLERAVQEINALPFSEKQRNAMVEVLMRKVNLMLDLDRQQVDIMRDGTP
ncbi:hypothetical protein [Streptosporangium lutulentum]|uniref:Uncharacterized protein n=1 Tax=Streptosporangium lutulentum TaxID=1461250 RepID=A0ABT9QAJ6_9ACTN|nr:hypothetical protein [Streptosporangium lutulentum]MDP9843318.1 hypothetical protein [Streptosporangium lutulentum]